MSEWRNPQPPTIWGWEKKIFFYTMFTIIVFSPFIIAYRILELFMSGELAVAIATLMLLATGWTIMEIEGKAVEKMNGE